MTDYPGIDYGHGKTNIDNATGIRFGVIAVHSVLQAWCDSSEPEYGAPDCYECPHCNECIDVSQSNWGDEIECEECGEDFEIELLDFVEPLYWYYNGEGYKLHSCLDNTEIMVIKSPYYTYAQFCSPCVPGAGNLNEPCFDGVKTYCLGADWFDNDEVPYRIYSVETGELIKLESTLYKQ